MYLLLFYVFEAARAMLVHVQLGPKVIHNVRNHIYVNVFSRLQENLLRFN